MNWTDVIRHWPVYEAGIGVGVGHDGVMNIERIGCISFELDVNATLSLLSCACRSHNDRHPWTCFASCDIYPPYLVSAT